VPPEDDQGEAAGRETDRDLHGPLRRIHHVPHLVPPVAGSRVPSAWARVRGPRTTQRTCTLRATPVTPEEGGARPGARSARGASALLRTSRGLCTLRTPRRAGTHRTPRRTPRGVRSFRPELDHLGRPRVDSFTRSGVTFPL